ncbi:uncharacterized protein LOC115212653 isoform X1 [Argonauta hians]
MDRQTKGKRGKIKENASLTDCEDSGVHLEESSSSTSGSKGWTENDLEYFIRQLMNPQIYNSKNTTASTSWSQQVTTSQTSVPLETSIISGEILNKCHIGSSSEHLPRKVILHSDKKVCACEEKKKSKHRTTVNHHKTKSEEEFNYESSIEISVDSVLDKDISRNGQYLCSDTTTITACAGSVHCVQFNDSCSDDPDSSENPQTQVSKMEKGHDGRKKEQKRRFFHRMIPRPLRRSHSCGNAKDLDSNKTTKTEIEVSEKLLDENKSTSIRKTSSFDARTLFLPNDLDASPVKPKSRNLAWNVKRRLHFLRRHHTDSSLTEKFPKISMVNAAKWGKSFEALIRDKDGLEIFRKYMRSEFSDENIDFWWAVEDYRAASESELEKKANIIFKTFVAKSAARAVNLRAPNREKVRQRVETNITRNMFDDAQKEIFDFMQRDTYQRFLKSDMYLNTCKSSS